MRTAQSPVFLLKFFVGFFLEFGQKLLQQFFGSVSVFERTALIRKMECGALASMKDELKLNFGFTIWADLLTYTMENIYLVIEHQSMLHHVRTTSKLSLFCTHSEYLHTGGWQWSGLFPLDSRQYVQPLNKVCRPVSSVELSSPPVTLPLIMTPWLKNDWEWMHWEFH